MAQVMTYNNYLGRIMIKKAVSVIVLAFLSSFLYAGTEYVTLIKVLDDSDQGIIERSNGERWLIEKGIGAISFWRYEGEKILIYSPGMFCGLGSKIILPDSGQEARIWNAELVNFRGGGTVNATSSSMMSDFELIARALIFLGYYDPDGIDSSKNNITLALGQFQKEHELSQTGKLSSSTQLALSNSVMSHEPITDESLGLASALLDSASRLASLSLNPSIPRPNMPQADYQDVQVETRISGEFEGWQGDTIVKLMNGQIWQQSEYYYQYHYSYMPKVTIISISGQFKMIIDGIPKAIGVIRLK